MSHIAEVASTVVGYGVMFEISPNALDGVHFGGGGQQVVDRDLPTLSLDMRLHELRAVGLQAIPYDEKLLACGGLQSFLVLATSWPSTCELLARRVRAPGTTGRRSRSPTVTSSWK